MIVRVIRDQVATMAGVGLGALLLLAPQGAALGQGAGAATSQPANRPVVEIETSLGAIQIELDPVRAPISVANFLKYVRAGFYSGTIFHRVIDGFMIQAGGYTADLNRKTTRYPPVKLESTNGLKNVKYSVAMARTSDPNSATSQFFINVVKNPRLDYPNPDGHGYAVFGRVVSGKDVVDAIRAVKTIHTQSADGLPMEYVPQKPVIIRSARLLADNNKGKAVP